MSASAITGKITCENGDIVHLNARQQTIVCTLGRRFSSREALVATLTEWEQKLSGAATPYEVGERMRDILYRTQEPAEASPVPVAWAAA